MISILCPTRKRCSGLERMINSALATADSPNDLEFVFYLDYDDIDMRQLLETNKLKINQKIIVSKQDSKEIYSNLHNICCSLSTKEIFFTSADDLIFRSNHWDTIVIDKFSLLTDQIAFMFPNDGYWGDKFGTHGFFHKKWFDTLGYISPPIFTVDYSDNYINDLAREINRAIYLEEIFIEHMHWTFGKMEFDDTAQKSHINRQKTNNLNIYQNIETTNRKKEDIEKLKRVIHV